MLCTTHTAAGWTVDYRTGAVDRVPLTLEDWNGRLYIANDAGRPYPLDKLFWIVTDEAEAVEVAYDREATFWMPSDSGPWFSRQDGECGLFSADEIMGWSFAQDDAEEAAELLARAG